MKNKIIIIIISLFLVVIGLGIFFLYNQKSNVSNNINKKYNIGDEIIFNNEKWNIIKESSETEDYVVALKSTALEELREKPYYECPIEDDNNINCNMKMSNDYKDSVAKKYFDNTYIKQLGKENLKEVNNYYVRLITIEELKTLGCNSNNCDKAPSWLLSNSLSWTMSEVSEITTNAEKSLVYAFGLDKSSTLSSLEVLGVGSTMDIRPVINLLKSSIE